MSIPLQFQELDDLIVKHTAPPVTPILRSKLSTLREQVEAQTNVADELATLKKAHTALQNEHEAFKAAQMVSAPAFKAYLCPHCGQMQAELTGTKTGPTRSDMMLDIQHRYYHCHKCKHEWSEPMK
jgi:predicted nucleic-acid-binding Zn-ribbon protein